MTLEERWYNGGEICDIHRDMRAMPFFASLQVTGDVWTPFPLLLLLEWSSSDIGRYPA